MSSQFGYIPQYTDLSQTDLREPDYTPLYRKASTKTGATTLTTTELLNGLVLMDANGSAEDLTTPTAAAIVGAMSNAQAGSNFVLHVRNTGGETITLVGGTGVTVPTTPSGTDDVATANAKNFLFVVTNADAGSEAITVYSLGTAAF